MSLYSIQTSFAAGELTPSLYGRVDLAKWHIGASTMRNFFVNYRGGAASRAGTAYVGMCKQGAPNAGGTPTSYPPRDIRFQFNINQGYALEFGDQYMRVKANGAYVTESFPLLGITNASPGVVSTSSTQAYGTITFSSNPIAGDTITFNGVTFTFVSGGSPAPTNIFLGPTLASSLVEAYLMVSLSVDPLLTVANYGVTSTQLQVQYKTGGTAGNAYTLAASRATVSASTLLGGGGGAFSNGDWVQFSDIVGMTGLNGKTCIVTGAATVGSTTTFNLTDLFGTAIDTTLYGTYVSGNAARVYTLTTPWAAVDLPYLKYTQSADTMSLCCVNPETETEYPPYELVRNGLTNWTLTQTTFASSVAAPTGLTATANNSTTKNTHYSYVVTAIDANGEESVASAAVAVTNNDIAVNAGSNVLTWTAVTAASSYNIYKATPSYNQDVAPGVLYGYCGSSSGPNFTDTNITADFTKVPPLARNPFAQGAITQVTVTAAGSGLTQSTVGYTMSTSTGSGFAGKPIVNTSGGLAGFYIANGGQGYVDGDSIAITGGTIAGGYIDFVDSGLPSDGDTVTLNSIVITFKTTVTGANQCHIGSDLAHTILGLVGIAASSTDTHLTVATYTASATRITITYNSSGAGGNAYTLAASVATVSGPHLTGGGTGSSATVAISLGATSHTYPSVPGYFQQRRVYANTLNTPDTYYMSQPGAFTNFDSSIPTSDSDAITGTPWGQQINGIQSMIGMPSGLIMLSGSGAWQITGAGNGPSITPANQAASPQAYNGCSAIIPPIAINYDILYVQAKGSIVRDLSYNFFTAVYTGTDMTVLSNHLFTGRTIASWAWAEEPYKVAWAVQDNGRLLSFTFLKEQDVYAWARHDTLGNFVGVCSVTEPPVDAVYFITQRYVLGKWVYYSERMDNRTWSNIEQSWCVDCGLAYPQAYPAASLTASATFGAITLTASASVFSLGSVGSVVRMGGGIMTITGFTSGTVVTASVAQAITETVPNDPNNTPLPATNGSWSISVPVSTVTGLDHIEGMTVSILGDGNVMPQQVVTNGAVTLPQPCSAITVGLPFTAQLQSLYLEPPGQPVTTQGRRKNLYAVTARVEASRGFSIGTNQPDASIQYNQANVPWTGMTEWKQRDATTPAGQPMPLFTGDARVTVPSSWRTAGQIAIQQSNPLPCNVIGIIPEFNVGDTPS